MLKAQEYERFNIAGNKKLHSYHLDMNSITMLQCRGVTLTLKVAIDYYRDGRHKERKLYYSFK